MSGGGLSPTEVPVSGGGLGPTEPATQKIQHIINELKPEVQAKCPKKILSPYIAVEFRTQIVTGTNYFIKVEIGGEYIHLLIFEPLPCDDSLYRFVVNGIQVGKTREDPLNYFGPGPK